jgi:hypothetical protein
MDRPIPIGKDQVNHYYISTVFLGEDYKPRAYETMVFENDEAIYEARYELEWEAKIGHMHAIHLARNDKFLPRESAPPTAQQL